MRVGGAWAYLARAVIQRNNHHGGQRRPAAAPRRRRGKPTQKGIKFLIKINHKSQSNLNAYWFSTRQEDKKDTDLIAPVPGQIYFSSSYYYFFLSHREINELSVFLSCLSSCLVCKILKGPYI